MIVINDDGSMMMPYRYRPGYHRSVPGDYMSPVFTYIEHHNRKSWHWSMDDVWRMIKAKPDDYPLHLFTTTEDNFNHVRLNNGIEFEHFERLRAMPGRMDEPGIMLIWRAKFNEDGQFNGSGTLIDGNHRLVLRYIEGKRDMQCHCITEAQAKYAELEIPWALIEDGMFDHIPPATK